MADSDEERDLRRTRDKFRRERNDSDRYGMSGGGSSNTGFSRGEYSRGGGMMGNQPRYGGYARSGDRGPMPGEPPAKRSRPYEGIGGMGDDPHRSGPPFEGHHYQNDRGMPSPAPGLTQPPMLTLKQFLANQDDSISEDDALLKYRVYKEEFARRQLDEFFNAHKSEPWFVEKYHPDHFAKRINEHDESVRKRLDVFMKFYDKVDGCRVHIENSKELIKLLDSFVIILEGGSEADLPVLEDDYADRMRDDSSNIKPKTRSKSEDSLHRKSSEKHSQRSRKDKSDGEESSSGSSSRSHSSGSSSRGSRLSRSSSGSQSRSRSRSSTPASDHLSDGEENGKEKRFRSPHKSDSERGTEKEAREERKNSVNVKEEPEDNSGKDITSEQIINKVDLPKVKGENENAKVTPYKPKPYHLTNSLFLRNLAPHISRQDIEELCRRYSGFKRLALQDPQPDRKFSRRGWATYSVDSAQSIKEICWNMNNVRLKDTDIGAIVNRPLSQRVRPVMVLANHRTQMRQDIKYVAKLIQKLDARQKLWSSITSGSEQSSGEVFPLESGNVLMRNITDFLVEEGSYEEEAFLGGANEDRNRDDDLSQKELTLEEDAALARVLDRLILYLRVVHSVDYYSASEYPGEDEMPHKCGIIHARGAHIHPDKPLMRHDLDEYMKNFETRILRLLESVDPLSEADCQKLGLKDAEGAVEAFIKANIQELAPEKWLCPLSGKKFKGPDFVRKHILNKHMEKVEVVRNEALFFNNYIRDPRRPQLPPHPVTKAMYSRSGVSTPNANTGGGYDMQRNNNYYARGPGGNQMSERSSADGRFNTGGANSDRYGRRSPPGGDYYRGNANYGARRYDNFYREDTGGSGGGRGGYFNRGFGGNRFTGFSGNRPRDSMGGRGRHSDRAMISYVDLDAPHE